MEQTLERKIEILRRFSACDVSDALLKLKVPGAGFLPDIVPFPAPHLSPRQGIKQNKLVALVSTVLFIPKDGLEQGDAYPEGNIPSGSHWADLTVPNTVVIVASPKVDNATVGGIMATRLAVLGARGVVIQGRARDAEEIGGLDIPVWAAGSSTVGAGAGLKAHAVQVPITIGAAKIAPVDKVLEMARANANALQGDIVFCDPSEGVVVIRNGLVDSVLEMLPGLVEADDRVKEAVKGGESVQGAFARYRG